MKPELIKYSVALFFILALHSVAMMLLENMSLEDSIWLTITSVTTVGYGDFSPETSAGRAATVILIYILGIAILANFIVIYFEYNQEVRTGKLKGNWSWKMDNHIVFLNGPEKLGDEYFYQAISQLRTSNSELKLLPIIIVTDLFPNGLPDNLKKLNVKLVNKNIAEDDALESASVKDAHTIVAIVRKQLDPLSDGVNFDLIDRIREMGAKGRIITEVVRDENRDRLKKAGANHVLRPIRSYPELLTRSIVSPGSEQIIESLFDSFGAECVRYDVNIRTKWSDVVHELSRNNTGIPIAYEDVDGKIMINPLSEQVATISAIFIIGSEGRIKTPKEFCKIMANIA